MKRSMIAILPLALLGCGTMERNQNSDFAPISQKEFVYRATASNIYRELDDPAAEAERLKWLRDHLAESGMCPNGYDITYRKPVYEGSGLGVDIYYVNYRGRCR